MHYIKVKTVNEILLKSIKEITDFAKEDKQEFLKLMNKLSDEKREEKYQRDKEKLEKLSSRNEELTTLITKLYEDHAFGKIPAKHFDRLFNIYDTEQQVTARSGGEGERRFALIRTSSQSRSEAHV